MSQNSRKEDIVATQDEALSALGVQITPMVTADIDAAMAGDAPQDLIRLRWREGMGNRVIDLALAGRSKDEIKAFIVGLDAAAGCWLIENDWPDPMNEAAYEDITTSTAPYMLQVLSMLHQLAASGAPEAAGLDESFSQDALLSDVKRIVDGG